VKTCSLDYETCSLVDLTKVGAYVYARDPSTKVLVACYSIDGGDVKVWAKWAGFEIPGDLREALTDPSVYINAWNSQFERLITQHVVGITVPIEKYLCTAAWARARGLPGKLADALRAAGLKDYLEGKTAGTDTMKVWMDAAAGFSADAPEHVLSYERLVRYCIGDVQSESVMQELMGHVPMTAREWADFHLTERINDRGVPIDRDLALAAASYGAKEKEELNEALFKKSLQPNNGYYISSSASHRQIKEWIRAITGPDLFEEHFARKVKGTTKESTDARARQDFLEFMAIADNDLLSRLNDPDDLAAEDVASGRSTLSEVLTLLNDASKASVGKFEKMAAHAADTGRAQGAYLYAGAGQTKRFSSKGIQMHNLPRAVPGDIDATVEQVKAGCIKGKVMHVLSSCLRPTIMAPAGRQIIWGDWSSVEARAMPWLAGAEAKLDLYRQGIDVYKVNAEEIYDTPYDEVTEDQRQVGKVAELALQFGGAVGALTSMARNYGLVFTEAEKARIVHRWRAANHWSEKFGRGLMRAFVACAFTTVQKAHTMGRVSYVPQKTFSLAGKLVIECRLPHGTSLFYPGITAADATTMFIPVEDGEPKAKVVVFRSNVKPRSLKTTATLQPFELPYKGVGQRIEVEYMKAMSGGMVEGRVWHGLLAENVTQALCATLLRDCLERVEAALSEAELDAAIIGHTHDELILEASDAHAQQAMHLLSREMVRVPEWLPGFPLGCEVKHGRRYSK